jgi:hypothetical protein
MGGSAAIRLVFLAALVAAFAVAPAPAASRHNGAPFWSVAQARAYVLVGRVYMNGREIRLDDALCMGTGKLHIKSAGVLKYRHFKCLLTPARERRFWIYVHTRPRGVFGYSFLHWA